MKCSGHWGARSEPHCRTEAQSPAAVMLAANGQQLPLSQALPLVLPFSRTTSLKVGLTSAVLSALW